MTITKPTHQPATYGRIQAGRVQVELPIRYRETDPANPHFELGLAKVHSRERIVYRQKGDRVWLVMDGRVATGRSFLQRLRRRR